MEEKKVVEPEQGKEQETNKEAKVGKIYDDNDLNNLRVKERIKILTDIGVEDITKAKEFVQKMKNQEEANKSDLQKKEEELQAVKGELSTKDQEIFDLKAEKKARALGIKDDYLEEVVVLAKAKTNSEKDFDTALKEVADKFGSFQNDSATKFGAEGKEQDTGIKKQKNWW